MNKILALLFCFGAFCSLKAQQIPLYNHYFVNQFVYNPAYTGISDNVNALLVRNSRNSNFQGGSINNYLTVDASLGDKTKYGLGIMLTSQNHGIQQQYGGGISYAYSLKINENQNLRFGVQAGFMDSQLDQSEINVLDADDPYLMNLNKNKLVFNGNVGLVYKIYNARIGFSVPQILGNKIAYSGNSSRGFYQLERHYLGTLSYEFFLSNDKQLSLKPNAVVRFSPNFPLQYDGLVQLDHQKFGWVSLGYKSDYALEFNVGIRFLGNFQVGYSYEYVVGNMKNYQSGVNHEFMLGLTLGNKDKKRIEELKLANEKLNQEKEALAMDKTSAEEKLRKMLEEQNAMKAKMVEDSIAAAQRLEASNDSISRLKKDLETSNQAKTEQNVIKKDTPMNTSGSSKNDKDLIIAKGYYFQELDGTDSPNGLYAVTGVFSSRTNADLQLDKCKKAGFESTKLIFNKNNNMFYVVILYTEDKTQALEENQKFRKKVGGKTWVLMYEK